MNSSNLESLNFFLNKNGGKDAVSNSLNCFEACVCNILKNKYIDERDMLAALFLREINTTLWVNDTTGVFRIYNLNDNIIPPWRRFVKVDQFVKRQDDTSLQFLESLLDMEQMVMIQTVFEKIKYYVWYDTESDINNFDDGDYNHISLAVSHEDDKIYFAEKMPYNLNMSQFVPCDSNKEIGVGYKSEFREAFDYFLRCFTISVDEVTLRDPAVHKKEIKETLLKITEGYSASTQNVNGYTRYYGAASLQKLTEFCENAVSLQNYYITPNWELLGSVTFDLWMIKGARCILKEYVKAKAEKIKKPERLDRLIELLTKSVMYWDNLSAMFVKVIKSDGMRLNEKIANFVRKITSLENELNLEIRSVLQNDLLI
ncbi:MAG TPA: hypothetical protein VHT34_08745 [Clostridia bacterium]|nr:hypothetical protein [Clostridia bacterium]